MDRQILKKSYMLLIIAAGAATVVYSAIRFPVERLDLRFLALAIFTIAVSSRLTIRIPRISGHISVSDTFFFLTILIYGGEAAVLLAATEALCSSLRFSKKAIHIKPLTIGFNSAMLACSESSPSGPSGGAGATVPPAARKRSSGKLPESTALVFKSSPCASYS